ncbi:hypothetical protein GGI35DRAFT_486180 [Trichoderma velutinum]
MAIGGQAKRQFLSATSVDYAMEDYSLSLSQWPSWNDLFLLDFESIMGGFYGDIAMYFCDLTLIFISDIGSFVNAINVLYRWMYRVLAAPYLTQANVFLVIDKGSIKEKIFWTDLATAMLSILHKSQPHVAYTLTEVMHLSRQCFNLKIKDQEEVYNYLCLNMRAKSGHCWSIGLDFSAAQWKYLFQSAIAQHATRPSLPFDLITATRISYPLPRKAEENITDFLQACGRQDVDHAQVIASALVMDIMKSCERESGILDLSQEIRIKFKRLAFNNKEDFMLKHIHYICSYANVYRSYFIIALLIEKWTFSECKDRIPYLKKLKWNKKKITFGKNLQWHLDNLRCSTNFSTTGQRKNDVKLHLFSTDKDSSSTHDISVQSSEPRVRKALFCTKSLLESCRNSELFSRRLKLSALSLDATISIQVDGINGNRHNISNCPYPLYKLISDQGLEAPFGSRRRRSSFSSRSISTTSNDLVDMEIDTLVETLQMTL